MVNGSMTFQLFPSLVNAITDLSVDGLMLYYCDEDGDGDIGRSVTTIYYFWRFYSSQGLLSETNIDPTTIEFALISLIRNEF